MFDVIDVSKKVYIYLIELWKKFVELIDLRKEEYVDLNFLNNLIWICCSFCGEICVDQKELCERLFSKKEY